MLCFAKHIEHCWTYFAQALKYGLKGALILCWRIKLVYEWNSVLKYGLNWYFNQKLWKTYTVVSEIWNIETEELIFRDNWNIAYWRAQLQKMSSVSHHRTVKVRLSQVSYQSITMKYWTRALKHWVRTYIHITLKYWNIEILVPYQHITLNQGTNKLRH